MTGLTEAVLLGAAVTTALSVLGGGLWWLLWPRMEARFRELARSVERVGTQLDPTRPDSLAADARTAAGATRELAEVRDQLRQLAADQGELARWRHSTDRRLSVVEESLVSLLANELRHRALWHPVIPTREEDEIHE